MYISIYRLYLFFKTIYHFLSLSVYTKVEGDLNTHRDNIASSTLEEGEKGKTRWSPHQEKPPKKVFFYLFFFLKTYIYLEWLLSFFSFFFFSFFYPSNIPWAYRKKVSPSDYRFLFLETNDNAYTGKENGAIKR